MYVCVGWKGEIVDIFQRIRYDNKAIDDDRVVSCSKQEVCRKKKITVTCTSLYTLSWTSA